LYFTHGEEKMKKTLLAGFVIGLFAIAMNGTVTTTPEPATMLLFGIGLITLAGFSKRMSHKK